MFTVSPDILILGFVAGFILYRLFSVLGRKDNDGDISISTQEDINKNMIDISAITKAEDSKIDIASQEKDIAPEFEGILEEIRKLDPVFSLKKFLDGAKLAFEMIIEAFAANDRNTLKELLDKNTYKQFEKEIERRIENKITLDLTLVALPVVKIKNINLVGKKVTIDMLYESQQITLLKDQKGNIVEGDSSQIDHIEDFWSFSKELNAVEDWKLVKVNAA
jgi:predicted lipid-binding transport protein (Tim44 family)